MVSHRVLSLAATTAVFGLACAVAGGSASAATVSETVLDPGQASQYVTAHVNGTGQDTDDITVALAGGTLTVVDATAPMVPAADRCAAVDDHTVRCTGIGHVVVGGGDGDDRVTVVAPTTVGVSISGGAGDDVLTGGPGYDAFGGGSGTDVIAGGGGGDEVYVDLDTDAPGLAGDRVDVRGGDSRLSITTHTPGVVADLAAGTLRLGAVTAPVLGVRNAILGPAPGTLLGDDGDNRLQGAGVVDGRAGNDRVEGMSGSADRLLGGAGHDIIDAGPGDDADGGAGDDALSTAQAPSGKPAKLACGTGDDDEVQPGNLSLAALDCEWTWPNANIVLATPRRTKTGVTLRARFSPSRNQCGVVVWALSASDRLYGHRVQHKLGLSQTHASFRLPVPRTARSMRFAFWFTSSCPAGRTWAARWTHTTLLALPRQ